MRLFITLLSILVIKHLIFVYVLFLVRMGRPLFQGFLHGLVLKLNVRTTFIVYINRFGYIGVIFTIQSNGRRSYRSKRCIISTHKVIEKVEQKLV